MPETAPPLPIADAATPHAAAPCLGRACFAEVLGTYLLIVFGCGAVHSAVLTGAQSGLWQVAIVWGVAIMLAVYVVGAISGAHINPAITIALAAWGRFTWRWVPAYIASQLAGAFAAAATLFFLYGPMLAAKEQQMGLTRGEPMSIVTAMCYGEYFPNPGGMAVPQGEAPANVWAGHSSRVTHAIAFVAEVLGTLILALVVFAVTDERNQGGPAARFAPVFIGLCVAVLISIIAPLTQACFNPARDFGPRLFAYLAGWGPAAIPGPNGHGWWTVYIAAPILGAWLGAGLYERVIRPGLGCE
jgi:glycerol uptake facilitator protein